MPPSVVGVKLKVLSLLLMFQMKLVVSNEVLLFLLMVFIEAAFSGPLFSSRLAFVL